MNVTNSAGDVVRTPTIQPEEWQPGETRDLPEEQARALVAGSHFTLATDETPAQAQPASTPALTPTPEPAPAAADPSPFAVSAEAPAQPTL